MIELFGIDKNRQYLYQQRVKNYSNYAVEVTGLHWYFTFLGGCHCYISYPHLMGEPCGLYPFGYAMTLPSLIVCYSLGLNAKEPSLCVFSNYRL